MGYYTFRGGCYLIVGRVVGYAVSGELSFCGFGVWGVLRIVFFLSLSVVFGVCFFR